MSKKRTEKAETMEPGPEGGRVLVYRREPAPDDLYEVGEWHGVAHYRCRLCAFDTMDAGNLLAHLDSHAGSAPAHNPGDASADLSMTNTLEVEDDGNRS